MYNTKFIIICNNSVIRISNNMLKYLFALYKYGNKIRKCTVVNKDIS